jgi:hypothetical protein
MKVAMAFAAILLASAGTAGAQSTTGTISGSVKDSQNLPLPGATVSVESLNLQQVRSAVTSENGDYILTLLPSGTYTVTFELSGFQRQVRTVNLAPTQVLPVDVMLGPGAISETVEVVGRTADVMMRTAQVATTYSQDLVATLPTNRDLNAALLTAASVHPTGPNGAYSISGGMSYENLFMVNGVTVNENVRGQAHDLYIEDAIQETTIAVAGISAEYGRFGGGVVNVITKSGGNTYGGSFRTTLHNDKWRALTPFESTTIANDPNHQDTRADATVPTYEFTFGGPMAVDRLWFFAAGRRQRQETGRQLVVSNIQYTFSDETERYEGKATYALNGNHRLQGAFTKFLQDQQNSSLFNPGALMDLRSLHDPARRMDLTTLGYTAILSPSFFVEARYSARNETTTGQGAEATDLIDGTLLIDRARGFRYWSPTFCGVCGPEERDNREFFVKGSYFLSTGDAGSHNVVFGYDTFNDHRVTNNYQSGSDYRIIGTTSIIRGSGPDTVIYPQFLGDGGTTMIQWSPILLKSRGADFRTHSAFVSDNWRVTSRLSATLGLRYDRNHGMNSVEDLVANDDAWSPRIGVTFDPTGAGDWSVTGGVAQYVSAIATTIGDASSPGGNANFYTFGYRGPSINADPSASLTSTPDAIRQVFDWFFANGGPNLPLIGSPTIRGVSPLIRDSLKSPKALEYSGGVNRQFGGRASVRADVVYRKYGDFYASRTDTTTGRVTDSTGRSYDLTLIENTNELKRRYAALTTQGSYRFDNGANIGMTYTLSRAWGNFEGEGAGGPGTVGILQYPEYREAEWNYPEGDLSIDQRHRARIWATYPLDRVPGVTFGLMQIIESGVPYGAVNIGGVNAQPYVTNPGYLTPLPATSTAYYYTAPDAFRTAGQRRTDLAVSYTRRLPSTRVELFAQAQVINVFNQYQLCGCGAATVFQNGGSVIVANRIDTTIRTSVTAPTMYQGFNPFAATPVRGVNWDYGPNFGKALSRTAFTTPRTFRMSVGIRF